MDKSLAFYYDDAMNPVYDFSAVDHAVMLGDQVRLELYHRAIVNQVKPGMSVVEIGTGTGILSAYAAAQTKAPITAIEYYEASAALASKMMKAAGFDQVKVLNQKSFQVTLDPPPQILITETIGALGPEENIVEICFDFKKRHPSITAFLPSKLRVMAEPIHSKKVRDYEQGFYDHYASASFGSFNFDAIQDELNQVWASRVRHDPLQGSEALAQATCLVEYHLGETETSDFSTDVDLASLQVKLAHEQKTIDAVHLYFECELDPEVRLSTHFSEPTTHWGHAYVSKPKTKTRLNISYSPKIGALVAKWIS